MIKFGRTDKFIKTKPILQFYKDKTKFCGPKMLVSANCL